MEGKIGIILKVFQIYMLHQYDIQDRSNMKEQLLSRINKILKLLVIIIFVLPSIKSYGQSTPIDNLLFRSSTEN